MASERSIIDDLYRDVIIDHSRHPHHFGEVEGADRKVEGYNPLCGDRITLFVNINGDDTDDCGDCQKRICDIGFTGNGCAICHASASMMTDLVCGKSVEETLSMFELFHRVMMSPAMEEVSEKDLEKLGEAAALAGVRRLPMRVKCATLAWHALKEAIVDGEGRVSTE